MHNNSFKLGIYSTIYYLYLSRRQKVSISGGGILSIGQGVYNELSDVRFSNHKHKRYVDMSDADFISMYKYAELDNVDFSSTDSKTVLPTIKESFETALVQNGVKIDDSLYIIFPVYKALTDTDIVSKFDITERIIPWYATSVRNREEFKITIHTKINRTDLFKKSGYYFEVPEVLYKPIKRNDNIIDKKYYIPFSGNIAYAQDIDAIFSVIDTIQMFNIDFIQREEDKLNVKKVICIFFEKVENNVLDKSENAFLGVSRGLKFRFCVAYKTNRGMFYVYKKYINKMTSVNAYRNILGDKYKNDNAVYDFEAYNRSFTVEIEPDAIIEWSIEKERFLSDIDSRITELSDKVTDFLSNINESNIERMITNNSFISLLK